MKKYFMAMTMMLSASLGSFAESSLSVKASNAVGDYDKVYASFVFGGASVGGFGRLNNYDAAYYFGGVDYFSMVGANIGYSHAFSLTSSEPLFFELGCELNYTSGSEVVAAYDQYMDLNVNMLNVQIPVNVTYHVPASDKFTIAPYAGFNLKINAVGTLELNNRYSFSMFNETDMEKLFDVGSTANRVQVGMNVGVNFILSKKMSFGYRFQQDLINYYKWEHSGSGVKLTTNNHYITLGYIL